MMPATLSARAEVLERMDQSKLSRLHWKIMFISGMGFLTDAYDLFIIGVVLAAISPDKSILSHTLMQLAVFAIAAAPGYLVAAAMIDRTGRKSIQMIGFVT